MEAFVTHSAINQVSTLEDYSLYETDLALDVEANRNPPRLIAYDRYGHRVDQIAFHSAWHQLMSGIVAHGLHIKAWAARPASRAHVARVDARVRSKRAPYAPPP